MKNNLAQTLSNEYPDARPLTRGECCEMPRPCPFVSCRHHLYLDTPRINGRRKSIRVNSTVKSLEVEEALAVMPETCSLDISGRHPDGLTLEQVGLHLGITRERVRQLESMALWKFIHAWNEWLEGEEWEW